MGAETPSPKSEFLELLLLRDGFRESRCYVYHSIIVQGKPSEMQCCNVLAEYGDLQDSANGLECIADSPCVKLWEAFN